MKRLGKHSIYTSSSHKRWVYIPIVLIVIISWMCMKETHISAFLHDVKSSSAMAEGNELRNSNDSRNSNDLRPSSDLRDFDSRGFRNLHVKNVDFRGENDTKISNKSMFAFAHAYVRLKITIDGFTREFAKNLKTVRVNIPSYNSTNNSRLYRNFLALSEDVEVNYKENPQIKSLPLDAFTSYTINLTLKNEGIYDLSKITVKSVSLRYPSRYRIYSNSKNYDSENNADNGISGNGISGNGIGDDGISGNVVADNNNADNNNADNSSLSISNFDNNQSFIRYIVIDNTRPKISVKYEDNNSRDMQYFNTRRIAHVTIQDENFALVKSLDPSMPIAVNSFNNNKVILTASDFTKEDTSKKWHATANYDDGFWCVLYGFVDLSGNKSEILKNSFIVDSRASNAGITNTGSNEKRASGSRDGGSRDSGSRASGSRDSDVDSSNSDAICSDAATDRNRASAVNNDSNNNTRNSNDSKSSSANVGNSKSAKKEATNENLNRSNKARKDDLAEKSVKASVKKIKRSSNNAANGAANGSANNAANKRVSQKANQKGSQKVGGKDSLKSAHNRKSDDINKRDSSPKRVEESNASDESSASKKQEKDEYSSNKTVQKTKDKSAEKNENDSEVSNTKSNKSVKKNKNVSRSVYRLHPRWKAILKDHNRAMPHDMADAIRLNRSARKSYDKKDSSKRASADSSNKSSTKSKKSSDNSANHDDSEEDSANKDKTSDKDSNSGKGDDSDKDSGSKSDDDKNSEDSKDKNKDDSENQGEISNEHSNKKLMSEDKSFSNNPSKNNNAGLLIAIAVIIVSVSGVCVVGYFVYRHDGKLFGN